MKIKYFLIALIIIFTIGSCSEDILDTNPTNNVALGEVFSTTENAYTALDGMYRAFYVYGSQWVEYYETENSGIAALQLAADLMGEDMFMQEQGSGWFWYDYRYWVRSEVNSTGDRPYSWWNMHYQFINNANYIIANVDNAAGPVEDINSIKAQGFALRAYSYFNLIRLYQRTYIGHENDPGVPLYTEPTTKETVGKGRGTVTDVYNQINADLDSAIARFANASPQRHVSHIDLYVAYGLKARVALTQNDWVDAANYAELAKDAHPLMTNTEVTAGFNSSANQEWMWGSEVNEEQSLSWPSFWSHMDASIDGSYAAKARKCVSVWLYDQIGTNDVRKGWFNDDSYGYTATGPDLDYNQKKFRVKQAGSWASDLLYMRSAEMYLIEAEARCRMTQYTEARQILTDLLQDRDPDFTATLAAIPDGNTLNLGSAGPVNNLLDFIILQRRIELWGEGHRIFDIMRLKTGFDRDYAGSNITIKLQKLDPESWDWIMMLPQKEFDGNINLDPVIDQNP